MICRMCLRWVGDIHLAIHVRPSLPPQAQQYFQLVGASASECDTIPGRQCMASCFFLLKQFEDVNIYLKSIKAYLCVIASARYFFFPFRSL